MPSVIRQQYAPGAVFASQEGSGSVVHVLAGQNASQANTSTSGPISQTHQLAGANAAGSTTSTSGAITQTHVLAGANATQSNTTTTGGINNVVIPSQFVAHVPAGVFSASVPRLASIRLQYR